MSREKLWKFFLIFLLINLLINYSNAVRHCGICGRPGHNRTKCPNRMGAMIPFTNPNINTNMNNAMVPWQNNMMVPQRGIVPFDQNFNFKSKNWEVPWSTHRLIKMIPYLGKICSICGSMGHRHNPRRNNPCPLYGNRANHVFVNDIKKSARKFFDDPNVFMSFCSCCGEIGHNKRFCKILHPPGAVRNAGLRNCMADMQKSAVKKGIRNFKEKYYMITKRIPQFALNQNLLTY